MRNPIIAALDVPTVAAALALAHELAPAVGGFKIGSELFTSAGPDMVRRIRQTGAAVFLDLKFHDIPNTVAKSVAAAVRLDVQWLTVHAGGGVAMMKAAEEAAHGIQPAPIVLGVTVLTSMDQAELSQTGVQEDPGSQVERLALLAARAGLRGLVCSPLEITALRRVIDSKMQLVTPGIRAESDGGDDQKRTLSAAAAMAAGADWLVIGRPICAAANPRYAAEKILASLPAIIH